MARAKKPSRPSTRPASTGTSTRPKLPLKIDHARIFALAAEADADEVPAAPSPPVPPPPAPAEDPIQALWAAMRQMREERAPTPAASSPAPEAIAQLVHQELVAVLPGLLREAVAQLYSSEPSPPTPTVPDQTQAWLVGELNALAIGLSAAVPPEHLVDNRKLADRLFLEAANSGRLFGITPKQFYTILAAEVRDLIFRIAQQSSTPAASSPVENTPALQDTHPNIEPVLPPPEEFRVDELTLTPVQAARHPREVARFRKIFEDIERNNNIVAPYYRLRTFAGRTDDEIVSLMGITREQLAQYLKMFTFQLIEATPH